MKRHDPKTIDRHLDGELSGDRSAEIAAAIEKDPAAGRHARETRAMGDLLRQNVEDQMTARPLPDLWPLIKDRVGKPEKPALGERIRVWVQSRFPHLPWPVWASAAAAVLAGLVLWVAVVHRTPATTGGKHSQKASNQIVFESIDYDGIPPTLFQIPDPDGQGSTTVIWVDADDSDDDDDNGAEPEPPTGDSI